MSNTCIDDIIEHSVEEVWEAKIRNQDFSISLSRSLSDKITNRTRFNISKLTLEHKQYRLKYGCRSMISICADVNNSNSCINVKYLFDFDKPKTKQQYSIDLRNGIYTIQRFLDMMTRVYDELSKHKYLIKSMLVANHMEMYIYDEVYTKNTHILIYPQIFIGVLNFMHCKSVTDRFPTILKYVFDTMSDYYKCIDVIKLVRSINGFNLNNDEDPVSLAVDSNITKLGSSGLRCFYKIWNVESLESEPIEVVVDDGFNEIVGKEKERVLFLAGLNKEVDLSGYWSKMRERHRYQ